MAKRTRPKKTKTIRKASRRVRSLAAKRGWETRRKSAAKRSRAAKRGWKTRRAQFRLTRERDTKPVDITSPSGKIQPSAEKEPLRDWVLSMSYRGRKGSRHFDFVASATSEKEAFNQLYEAHPWTKHIPWQKVTVAKGPTVKGSHPVLKRGERASSSRKKTKSKSTSTARKQSRRSTRKQRS